MLRISEGKKSPFDLTIPQKNDQAKKAIPAE